MRPKRLARVDVGTLRLSGRRSDGVTAGRSGSKESEVLPVLLASGQLRPVVVAMERCGVAAARQGGACGRRRRVAG